MVFLAHRATARILTQVKQNGTTPTRAPRVRDVRNEVERLGTALAEVLGVLVGELSERAIGPMDLASILDTSAATAGKLLRAISRPNAVGVVQGLPGPVPLRQLVERATERGAKESTTSTAMLEIATYAELVRHAGDIKSFEAMLSAWLPEERQVFETARRQAAFRALSEIDGASCRLQINTVVLAPGTEERTIDLVGMTGLLGVHRMRPDAQVALATLRVPNDPDPDDNSDRKPTSLDGVPLESSPQGSRLDDFCLAQPAPLVARQFGEFVQYTLGPTDIGPAAEFDLLMAELNRNVGRIREITPGWQAPFFSTLSQFPARILVFDLIVHREIYPECKIALESYAPGGRGLASPHDSTREMDRRECLEQVTEVDYGLRDLRLVEYPKYSALVRHVLGKLGRETSEFRAYRVKVQYPLPMNQFLFAFRGPND